MKNHRKIISLIALLISFLLIISFYGCRTSKKIVEKSKVDIEKSELKINKIDSISSVNTSTKSQKLDSITWNNYMKYYDISYLGTSIDDIGAIERTSSGWKFLGKVKVSLKGSENNSDSIIVSNSHQITNEQLKLDSNSKIEVKSNDSQIKINKNKENHTLGFTIGVLIALILLGALMTYLCYRYLLNKK
ncbi:hypothetical protein [Chishuiella sp.]|uniref:hypothetical protein n=1 Tax=Chishuiella sp. TaxID=1969467 RepID=UPI0028ABE65C|nr:hypothetical protein [Chishuiella sp.]